jgi:DNA-binding LytR/AlgR family response regulator
VHRGTGIAPWMIYAALALGTVLTCTVNALSTAHDLARLGRAMPFWQPVLWEATSGVVVVALAPLIRRAFIRAKRFSGRPALLLAVHAGAALAFSALHILGMILLRKLAYAITGAGAYEFGATAANLLYELRKDVLVYALFTAIFWAAERLGRVPAVAIAVAPEALPAPSALWLRDGSVNLKVAPGEIVSVVSAGNYVEYGLADGRRPLIRTTLQTEEDRLRPLGFVRIHRTRLINTSRIRRLVTRPSGDFDIEMDTGESFAGSRRYRGEVAALIEMTAPVSPAAAPHSPR